MIVTITVLMFILVMVISVHIQIRISVVNHCFSVCSVDISIILTSSIRSLGLGWDPRGS